MISTSGVGGYQRAAEEFVGIERKRLSVFVLHAIPSPIFKTEYLGPISCGSSMGKPADMAVKKDN